MHPYDWTMFLAQGRAHDERLGDRLLDLGVHGGGSLGGRRRRSDDGRRVVLVVCASTWCPVLIFALRIAA